MEKTIMHRLLGRPYLLALLEARPRRIKRNGKVYYQYTVNLPKRLVELVKELDKANPDLDTLLGEESLEPEPIPLTVLVAPSPWYHLVDWDEMSARAYLQLPEKMRKELEALGLGPVPDRDRVLIPARPDQLRELGLDPDQPLTLQDVVEAVKRRLVESQARKVDNGDSKEVPVEAPSKPV